MNSDNLNLDQIDRRIINALVENARLPITELARKVGLSKTPVAQRLRRLERAVVIRGYRAQLSPLALGLDHVAFVQVTLSDTRKPALEEFNRAVRAIPEIEECTMIAGGFDYLLKVRSRDIADYRRVMGETISALPHLRATTTYVAMEVVVEQAPIRV